MVTGILLVGSGLAQIPNPEYDTTLVKKFGADERGMKNYTLVILKTGTANITDTAFRQQLFKGHFDNIIRLANEGKLIVAGPLEKNERTYRGIFIFNTESFDEVKEFLKGDPTVTEKIFDVEMFRWYGSAALPAYLDADRKLHKFKDEI